MQGGTAAPGSRGLGHRVHHIQCMGEEQETSAASLCGCRTGSVVADGGSFGAVDLTSSGVNKVYLKGDMSSVTVHLSGEQHCF